MLSFTDAALKPVVNFVGWENYEKIFKPRFGEIIIRTFIWTFFSVGTKMVIGTAGAMLLAAAVPGRTIFRILTMPPWIIPMAIGIFMWGWMYNGQFGMLSGLLQNFGIIDKPFPFLAYGTSAFWATIVTDVWIGVPMVTIYLLAAVQSVPRDLYEAAWTDGAGRWYRFRRITLPMIAPAMVTMSILSLIANVQLVRHHLDPDPGRTVRTDHDDDHRHLQDRHRQILLRPGRRARGADLHLPECLHLHLFPCRQPARFGRRQMKNETAMIDRYKWWEKIGIYIGILAFLSFVLAPFVEGFLVSLKPLFAPVLEPIPLLAR